jgi:hypothetical protein
LLTFKLSILFLSYRILNCVTASTVPSYIFECTVFIATCNTAIPFCKCTVFILLHDNDQEHWNTCS